MLPVGSSRPGEWLNAKKSSDGAIQAAGQTEPGAARLASAADSSEDEALNTLQRKRRSQPGAKVSSTPAQVPAEEKMPQPRGRPRKERPFEVRTFALMLDCASLTFHLCPFLRITLVVLSWWQTSFYSV